MLFDEKSVSVVATVLGLIAVFAITVLAGGIILFVWMVG